MLMKLTPLVNFTVITWATFVLIFFCKKITNPNSKKSKAAKNNYVQKADSKKLMKLTP